MGIDIKLSVDSPGRVRFTAIILVLLIFVGSITVFHWHMEKYYTLKNNNQTDPISFLWLYWPRLKVLTRIHNS